MSDIAEKLISQVLEGRTPAEAITEITKVRGGRRVRIDPKKSRIAKKAAAKRGKAGRQRAAKKAARTARASGAAKRGRRKAQRTKKKFGSIGASKEYTAADLVVEWRKMLAQTPESKKALREYIEGEIAALQPYIEDKKNLWEAEGANHINRLADLCEALTKDSVTDSA